MNIEIRKLQADLVEVLNKSSFPLELKRLVLSELVRKLEIASEAAILEETKEVENAENIQQN